MDVLLIAALAFAPGLFWLGFFYRRDRLEPEPRGLVLRTFVLGIVATVPAALLESPFHRGLLLGSVAAPVIEELCKFAVVYLTMFRHPEFDEPMDGIVYGVAAALGFASAENTLYVVHAYLRPETVFGTTSPMIAASAVYWIRALLSVPGHALWAAMWGYALGWAKFHDPARRRRTIAGGLALAMLLHAIFNTLLAAFLLAGVGMLVLVPVMWRLVNRRIRLALGASPFAAAPPPTDADHDA